MVIEHLLGFDARLVPQPMSVNWPPERRLQFLLRTDIAYPLSVDNVVWPSIFVSENRPVSGVAQLKMDGWTGANHGLWDDLNLLYARLKGDREANPIPYWLVAVSYEGEAEAPELSKFGPHLEATEPTAVNPDWTFLGYDIADGSLLSGLSNCGQGETNSLWGQHLNEWHLFVDLESATEFAQLLNDQIPEHAPFFVYALWRISDGLNDKL